MSPATYDRLFNYTHAFESPVTLWMTVGIASALAIAPLVIVGLGAAGKLTPGLRRELLLRYYSWLVIAPLLLACVLLGAFWLMLGVGVLSLACYREYARATGLFRERLVSALVALGIVVVTVSALDNWYAWFVALFPISVGVLAAVPILEDRPKGYIQRVALAVLAFSLFGSALGHLGYLGNDRHYRPMVLLILMAVELNDVFAFICGKT
ncbi:MAG TPA: phosphatidate cytidylyltransferase, partial [Pirellulales bacterium]